MPKRKKSPQLKRQVVPTPTPAPFDDYHRQALFEGFLTFMLQRKGYIEALTGPFEMPIQIEYADRSDSLIMRIEKLQSQATLDTPDWQITIAALSGSVLGNVVGVACGSGMSIVLSPLLIQPNGQGAAAFGAWYLSAHFSLYLKERVQG